MAVVGPRPERPELAEKYEEEMPEFAFRLRVKAGLTGYAQVIGLYDTTPYDKLKMDLMYIEKYSLLLDLQILLMTIKTALFPGESNEELHEQTHIPVQKHVAEPEAAASEEKRRTNHHEIDCCYYGRWTRRTLLATQPHGKTKTIPFLTADKETMLQKTVNRLKPLLEMDAIYVVTNQRYAALVQEQLPELPAENILPEPCSRNTAPCIGLAAAVIQKRCGEAMMLVLPSDHLIRYESCM